MRAASEWRRDGCCLIASVIVSITRRTGSRRAGEKKHRPYRLRRRRDEDDGHTDGAPLGHRLWSTIGTIASLRRRRTRLLCRHPHSLCSSATPLSLSSVTHQNLSSATLRSPHGQLPRPADEPTAKPSEPHLVLPPTRMRHTRSVIVESSLKMRMTCPIGCLPFGRPRCRPLLHGHIVRWLDRVSLTLRMRLQMRLPTPLAR